MFYKYLSVFVVHVLLAGPISASPTTCPHPYPSQGLKGSTVNKDDQSSYFGLCRPVESASSKQPMAFASNNCQTQQESKITVTPNQGRTDSNDAGVVQVAPLLTVNHPEVYNQTNECLIDRDFFLTACFTTDDVRLKHGILRGEQSGDEFKVTDLFACSHSDEFPCQKQGNGMPTLVPLYTDAVCYSLPLFTETIDVSSRQFDLSHVEIERNPSSGNDEVEFESLFAVEECTHGAHCDGLFDAMANSRRRLQKRAGLKEPPSHIKKKKHRKRRLSGDTPSGHVGLVATKEISGRMRRLDEKCQPHCWQSDWWSGCTSDDIVSAGGDCAGCTKSNCGDSGADPCNCYPGSTNEKCQPHCWQSDWWSGCTSDAIVSAGGDCAGCTSSNCGDGGGDPCNCYPGSTAAGPPASEPSASDADADADASAGAATTGGAGDLVYYTHGEEQNGFFGFYGDTLAFASTDDQGDVKLEIAVVTHKYKNDNPELAMSLVSFGKCSENDIDVDELFKMPNDNSRMTVAGGGDGTNRFDVTHGGFRSHLEGENSCAESGMCGSLGDVRCFAYNTKKMLEIGGPAGEDGYAKMFGDNGGKTQDNVDVDQHYEGVTSALAYTDEETYEKDNAGRGFWKPIDTSTHENVAVYRSNVLLESVRDHCGGTTYDADEKTTFWVSEVNVRPSQLVGAYPSNTELADNYHSTCSEQQFSVTVSSELRAAASGLYDTGAKFKVVSSALEQCTRIDYGSISDARPVGTAGEGLGIGDGLDMGAGCNEDGGFNGCALPQAPNERAAYRLNVKIEMEFRDGTSPLGNPEFVGVMNVKMDDYTQGGGMEQGKWEGDVFNPIHGTGESKGGGIRGMQRLGSTNGEWTLNNQHFGRNGLEQIDLKHRVGDDGHGYTKQIFSVVTDCINIGEADDDTECDQTTLQGNDFGLQFRLKGCENPECLSGGTNNDDDDGPSPLCETRCRDLRTGLEDDEHGKNEYGLNYPTGSKHFPVSFSLQQYHCPADFAGIVVGDDVEITNAGEVLFFNDLFHPNAAAADRSILTYKRQQVIAGITNGKIEYVDEGGVLGYGRITALGDVDGTAHYRQGELAVAVLRSTTTNIRAKYTTWLKNVRLCKFDDPNEAINAAHNANASPDANGGCDDRAAYIIVKEGVPQSNYGATDENDNNIDYFKANTCKYAKSVEAEFDVSGGVLTPETRCPDTTNKFGTSNRQFNGGFGNIDQDVDGTCATASGETGSNCGFGDDGAMYSCDLDLDVEGTDGSGLASWDAVWFSTDYMIDSEGTQNIVGDHKTYWLIDMRGDSIDCSAGTGRRRLRAAVVHTREKSSPDEGELASGALTVEPRAVTAAPTSAAVMVELDTSDSSNNRMIVGAAHVVVIGGSIYAAIQLFQFIKSYGERGKGADSGNPDENKDALAVVRSGLAIPRSYLGRRRSLRLSSRK